MGKAEKTRSFIVEKAAPLFNAKGYAGTSVSDLIEVTGLTKGSIYGNFENKDEVAVAAFEHNWNRVVSLVREHMALHRSCLDKLLVLSRLNGGFPDFTLPEGGCPLLNTAIEADDTHPILRKKAAAALLEWKRGIVALIRAGIAGKEFRAEVDAERTAVTLIALIEGGIMIARLSGDARHAKVVMSAVEKIIRELA